MAATRKETEAEHESNTTRLFSLSASYVSTRFASTVQLSLAIQLTLTLSGVNSTF